MIGHRNDKLRAAILHAAQEFVNRESNRTSLITVTKVDLTHDSSAVIFVSVFPPEKTGAAIDFLSRLKTEFIQYFKKNIRIRSIPHIEFMADPAMGSVVEKPET